MVRHAHWIRNFRAVLFGLALLLPLSAAHRAHAEPNIEALRESVVVVLNYKNGRAQGRGTGFAVSSDGYILTNNHVTAGGNQFYVITNNSNERYKATLISTSRSLDISILRVNGLNITPLPLSETEIPSGGQVWAIGYPGAAETVDRNRFYTSTTTRGIFSRKYTGHWGKGGTLQIVQHSAQINPGNSGGPLFDNCGRVVGVNTALPSQKVVVQGNRAKVDGSEGIFFSSHISESLDMLREARVNVTKVTQRCRSDADRINSVTASNNRLQEELKEERRLREAARIEQVEKERLLGVQRENDAKLQKRLMTGVAIAIILLAILTLSALIFAMRKPKHPFVRSMSRMVGMSNQPALSGGGVSPRRDNSGGRSSNSGAQTGTVGAARRGRRSSSRKSFSLSGFDHDGHVLSFQLDGHDLSRPEGISFGRSRDFSDQVLDDSGVSKRHFRLRMEQGSLIIEDLNSTNGTSVAGRRISPYNPQKLRRNDRITVGQLQLDVNL